ncbi:hypothetical protein ACFLYV_02040 [Chloroflexota bacterium]
MDAKYHVGQEVVVYPVDEVHDAVRGGYVNRLSGHVGQVKEYFWINPNPGSYFYVYTVKLGSGNEEVVLHEDEIENYRS